MKKKINHLSRFWNENSEEWRNNIKSEDVFDFSEFDSLELFTGTHPAVMQERIARKNFKTELDVSKKNFSLKGRILYWLEKKTGYRPFDFKNYRLLRN